MTLFWYARTSGARMLLAALEFSTEFSDMAEAEEERGRGGGGN